MKLLQGLCAVNKTAAGVGSVEPGKVRFIDRNIAQGTDYVMSNTKQYTASTKYTGSTKFITGVQYHSVTEKVPHEQQPNVGVGGLGSARSLVDRVPPGLSAPFQHQVKTIPEDKEVSKEPGR